MMDTQLLVDTLLAHPRIIKAAAKWLPQYKMVRLRAVVKKEPDWKDNLILLPIISEDLAEDLDALTEYLLRTADEQAQELMAEHTERRAE